jgi:hypothetical protein
LSNITLDTVEAAIVILLLKTIFVSSLFGLVSPTNISELSAKYHLAAHQASLQSHHKTTLKEDTQN